MGRPRDSAELLQKINISSFSQRTEMRVESETKQFDEVPEMDARGPTTFLCGHRIVKARAAIRGA
jgi:hypothetical protein